MQESHDAETRIPLIISDIMSVKVNGVHFSKMPLYYGLQSQLTDANLVPISIPVPRRVHENYLVGTVRQPERSRIHQVNKTNLP